MDDRQAETVSDVAIDREIRELLAVDPSPEFLARVRTHIANEPSRMRFPWAWASAGTIAVVLMAVALVPWRNDVPADLKVGTTKASTATADLKVGTTEGTPTAADLKVSATGTTASTAHLSAVVRQDHANSGETAPELREGGKAGTTDIGTTRSVVVPTFRSARTVPVVNDSTEEWPLPQVLISSDDARAFREFMAFLGTRNYELSFEEAFDITETAATTALTIQPITTEPLNPSVSDEGAFQ